MEFQVGDKVMLKVSPWKGVVCFGKRGNLNPRYVGPFKVLERVGDVAYKLDLPEELSRVHNMFYVSNLKKCHADEPLAVSLDGLHFDDKLHFVEEPVEIMDRKVKRLKQSRIPSVKVASDDLHDALSVLYLTSTRLSMVRVHRNGLWGRRVSGGKGGYGLLGWGLGLGNGITRLAPGLLTLAFDLKMTLINGQEWSLYLDS
nr:putative reverse transcriptase domain-containing protein [Tanacetum cinerariifolium]